MSEVCGITEDWDYLDRLADLKDAREEGATEQREADEANRRAQLEKHGLWEEFGMFGCDTVDHLGDALVAALEKTARLRSIGAQMANACYNLSQRPTNVVSDHEREIIADLFKEWDAAKVKP